MTMVMMTAMALTRETERGTMENLLAMPATPAEIMLGKVLPFLAVGGVQVVVVLAAAKLLFGVPFVGSLALLLTCVLIFVLSLVLLGYTISTASRTQMQAMQLTFFFFLPSLMLSGFMFPFRGMPDWAQALGRSFPHAFPAYRPRRHAEGRPPFRHCRRGERPLVLRGAVCVAGAVKVPADAGLAGRWSQRRFRTARGVNSSPAAASRPPATGMAA